MSDKLRIRFTKTGRAVYISHLDLMQTMQRAFSRAGYALKYSEGYNPHPLISIALPLSVGAGSLCELMDFRLREDVDLSELPARLTASLPEGIKVLEAYEPERKCSEIKWLSIEGLFEYDERDGSVMTAALREFFARDIRPEIRSIEFEEIDGDLTVNAVISAQEPTLNPELLAEALRQLRPEFAPDFARFTRLETYDKDMKLFR